MVTVIGMLQHLLNHLAFVYLGGNKKIPTCPLCPLHVPSPHWLNLALDSPIGFRPSQVPSHTEALHLLLHFLNSHLSMKQPICLSIHEIRIDIIELQFISQVRYLDPSWLQLLSLRKSLLHLLLTQYIPARFALSLIPLPPNSSMIDLPFHVSAEQWCLVSGSLGGPGSRVLHSWLSNCQGVSSYL